MWTVYNADDRNSDAHMFIIWLIINHKFYIPIFLFSCRFVLSIYMRGRAIINSFREICALAVWREGKWWDGGIWIILIMSTNSFFFNFNNLVVVTYVWIIKINNVHVVV